MVANQRKREAERQRELEEDRAMEEKLKRDREELKQADELERKRKQDKIDTSIKVNLDLLERRKKDEEDKKAKFNRFKNIQPKREPEVIPQPPVIDSTREEPEVIRQLKVQKNQISKF